MFRVGLLVAPCPPMCLGSSPEIVILGTGTICQASLDPDLNSSNTLVLSPTYYNRSRPITDDPRPSQHSSQTRALDWHGSHHFQALPSHFSRLLLLAELAHHSPTVPGASDHIITSSLLSWPDLSRPSLAIACPRLCCPQLLHITARRK